MTVAVITTCWNEAEWIGDAVESVLAQTRPPLQHVVVDDGSTDGSAGALHRYPDLTVLRITNRGMPAARTAGLLALEDAVEWVVYLDGDDWMEPNLIEECLREARRGMGAEVVFPARVRVTGPGMSALSSPTLPAVQHPTESELWQQCHGTSCAMISRALLVQTGGFHPATGGDCDWDFWIDANRRGARFAYAPGTHYNYRVRPDSYSRVDGERLRPQHLAEMERHHLCSAP